MLDSLSNSSRPVRTLPGAVLPTRRRIPRDCSRTSGFRSGRKPNASFPLLHLRHAGKRAHARKTTAIESLPVRLRGPNNAVFLDTTYKKLLQLDFHSTHKLTGKKVYFTIYVGTQGAQRGVPVQIGYQPNWWFQVVLNFLPHKPVAPDPAVAAR
jgi:hypothetical protein